MYEVLKLNLGSTSMNFQGSVDGSLLIRTDFENCPFTQQCCVHCLKQKENMMCYKDMCQLEKRRLDGIPRSNRFLLNSSTENYPIFPEVVLLSK
jgi:hypothetical protein